MDDRTLQSIKQHLQSKDAQDRILKNIERGRSEATVTIGRAAELFGFTENQLRDWEARGLISPKKSAGGQRLYPLTELDRLAIIRELFDTKFSLSDIPEDVDRIWNALNPPDGLQISMRKGEAGEVEEQPIDKRVELAERDSFWRHFVSQVMRLSLLLICEEMPGTIAGLILPLEHKKTLQRVFSPFNIAQVGPSLVGWLGPNQTFYASYDSSPAFEYPSDFRIEYLPGWNEKICPAPIIVVQRRTRTLAVTDIQVASMQRIFDLVYKHVNDWLSCFKTGRRDLVDHVTNFDLSPTITDALLDQMMNMIVELGGEEGGVRHWKFCNLFVPQDPSLPLQQRMLTVRAHSNKSPAPLNSRLLTMWNQGLTFRAYQSGQVFYRPHITPQDALIAYHDSEESTQSAISIPLGSSDGMVAGAIYIASDEVDAFTLTDQRALRLLTRMLEEMLASYQARLFVSGKLSAAFTRPRLVDVSFGEFLSEEDFIDEFEALLNDIFRQNDAEQLDGKEVSFITIDIDNQSPLAVKYGDRAARNLSREVGIRLQGQLRLQSNTDYRKVFHVGADRYHVKLVGMPLDDARNLAEGLHLLLRGDYRINVRRFAIGRLISRDELLVLQNVTVRVGVSNYKFTKLKEVLLRRDEAVNAMTYTRMLILDNLDQTIRVGQAEGGDCVISWDHDKWGWIVWSRGKPS